jgi:hypothetical protein
MAMLVDDGAIYDDNPFLQARQGCSFGSNVHWPRPTRSLLAQNLLAPESNIYVDVKVLLLL